MIQMMSKLEKKRLLVIIDMQKELFTLKAELAPDETNSVIDSTIRKIQEFDTENIIVCKDTRGVDILGESELEIIDDISKKIYGARTIVKRNDYSYELAKVIKAEAQQKQLEIEIVGAMLDQCVIANALVLRLMIPDAKIFVDLDCCLASDMDAQDAAVEVLKSCKIEVI